MATLEGVMHGVYLVWLVQERGFAPALVASILAAGDLAVFLLEVPTGWLADRVGYRASLIAGSCAQILGMLAFWWAHDAPTLLMASLLVAIGDACRSGAGEALLYRTCLTLGRPEAFQQIEAQTRAWTLTSLVALLLVGGALASVASYDAAWTLEIACSVTGLVLALAMVEPPPEAAGHAAASPSAGDPVAAQPSRLWSLLRLAVPAAAIDGLGGALAFLAQTGGDDVAGVTALVAAITLAEAAGSAVAAKVKGGESDARRRLQWQLLAVGLSVAAGLLLLPGGVEAASVALAFLVGVMLPLRAVAIQSDAAEGARARMASIASALDMAASTVALLVSGMYAGRTRRG